MGGLLVPPWYENEEPTQVSFALITFLFGFSTACGVFTAVTISNQAHRTWRRSHRLVTHPYIIMIVVEWVSSVVISIISYLFILDVIPPSFWLFFGILCLWVLQIQCIMHIIVNRIALIKCDPRRTRKLKWAILAIIGAINISVFIIWIPARLQISAEWIHLNDIWDRVEKGIFLLVDLGLNLYFLHIVRSELIAHGLTKYWNLYWFNVGMIFISISLDILLIIIMSIPRHNTFIYVQFHPLMYLIKLKIEMNMADLIVKIVKTSARAPGHELHRYAVSAPAAALPPRQQRPSVHVAISHGTSDASTNIKIFSMGDYSQTNIVREDTLPSRHQHQHQHQQQQQQQQQQSLQQGDVEQGWELTRMPSNFDAGDVVDARKASVAEGSCVGMESLATELRPPLVRTMSELTELEVAAGYLDQDTRNKRTSESLQN